MKTLILIIGVLLVLYVCHFAQASTIIGSNESRIFNVADRQRFYLNIEEPALCNGTVTRLDYCYYGESRSSTSTYQSLVAIYRPISENDEIINYQRIVDTITLSKQTSENPDEPVSNGNVLLPGFNCDSYQLEESVQVLIGDLIGACIYETSDTRRLDLVSRTDEGYIMRITDASDVRCQDGVVPEVIDNRRLDDAGGRRILHIFAEINPEITVTTIITTSMMSEMESGTSPATNQSFLNSPKVVIVGIVVGGVLLGILLLLVTVVIIIKLTRRSKRNNNDIKKTVPHRNSLSNLIVECHEEELNEHPQNFSCHYDRVMDSAFTQQAELPTENRMNHQLAVAGRRPLDTEEATNYLVTSRNSHYEMQLVNTSTRNEYHHYFTLEGPNCPYYELLEKNITEDIYDGVAQFVEPAREEKDLYAQIKSQGIQNIDRSSIQVCGLLGAGQFGRVDQGVLRVENLDINVALKTLNKTTTDNNKVKFLQEAAIMAQFRHPNVILFFGIVCKSEPITMVSELVEKGDLRNYLMTLRPKSGELPDSELPRLLLSFSQHVALGMQYLSSKGFVHRDLAARNVLVSIDNFCKIADFGLSRDLANEKYYISNGGLIPIKWTAPEAIHYKKYSSASDVWSYGCLLYEIWSLARKPYENLSNIQAVRFVSKGKRLHPPPGCPRAVYDLMIKCWNPTKDHRPNFRTVHLNLLDNGTSVLSIPQVALDSHHLAGVLGAPLTAGETMFVDLQTRYEEVAYYDSII